MKKFTLELSEKDLELLVSSLLFTSSVNVIGQFDEQVLSDSVGLATRLKQCDPTIQLTHIEFLKEDDYEDATSKDVYNEFNTNFKTTTFEEA